LYESNVRFTALEEDAEYTWYIGSEVLNDKSFVRYFSDQWKESNIPVTLVVKKQPNKACFPDDDGYDSIVKTFHVSKYPIDNGDNQDMEFGSIEGYYRVFSKELNDSIDIYFDVVRRFSNRSANVANVDGSGTECIGDYRIF
jgi:hypothetical protein